MQRGLFLAFEPVVNEAGDINSYRIHLINRTLWKVVFDGYLHILEDELQLGGSVENENTTQLAYMPKANLNDYPTFDLTLWRWTTEGQDGRVVKHLKIKPRQFFKKETYSPYLNADVHLYQLADDFAPPVEREDTLRNYTKDNLPEKENKTIYDEMYVRVRDVKAWANFEKSIDLHIHMLTKDFEKMDAAQSLYFQLEAFEKYINDAILTGVPYVYVIHGKGKGRLQEEIHRRLKDNPQVIRFEDGYHEGYGTGGATKVIF